MEFHITTLFLITICLLKLVDCQICNPNNSYVSDPKVLPLLKGVLYQVYTNNLALGNIVYKFKQDKPNKQIWAHTTDDSGCCKLIYMSTVQQQPGGYYDDWFSNPASTNCGPAVNQGAVVFKPLFTNSRKSGRGQFVENTCVIMWVCRATREAVHVYCQKQTVSANVLTWIQEIGSTINVDFVPIVQNNTLIARSTCIAGF